MNDTNFLRFIAILLIVNSHSGDFYPITSLGTGGALGNSLFFMLSSLGLYLSTTKYKKFLEWCGRRAMRLYPSYWVFFLLLYIPVKIIGNQPEVLDPLVVIKNYFIPSLWFLKVLLVFYFFIYFIIKDYSNRKLFLSIFLAVALYFYFYLYHIDLSKWSIENYPFKVIFYFLVYLFGVILGSQNEKIKYSGARDIFALLLFISLIYLHKYLMTKSLLSTFQFLQHLFIIPSLYYFIKISRSDLIQKTIMSSHIISGIVNYVSNITLEIYMVHLAIRSLLLGSDLAFPINMLLFITLTLGLSVLIKFLSEFIRLNVMRLVYPEFLRY